MTEYVHKYPFGAIESEEPIVLGLLGQTLYGVHGLGSSSFLTVMSNVRNLETIKLSYTGGTIRKMAYTDVTRENDPWDTDCCLGDFNIGAHHNHHYLFHNREDAEAYLLWARENTAEIKSDPWWDDYDYDDHDWGYDYDED